MNTKAPKSINEFKVAPIYPSLLLNLLSTRGIKNSKEIEDFLNPDYENHIHDPYLLKDMNKAVERILEAVDKKEKILIYSDYDADGIPGGVILREFFEKIGHKNVENYIPDRHEEGFGVHKEAVESFGKESVNLLITVDCGIADVEPINRAVELGMDVIITDHHEPNGKKSRAHAVLNPKQEDCPYPFKELCGSGVVYKLIQGILHKNRFNFTEGQEKWFLDLVGLATLSDMVPLVGENRVLAHYGIKVLRKSSRPGLQKILSKVKVNQSVLSEDDIAFSITPRLNAASRMGHPVDTFNLLFTKDQIEAGNLSDYLHKVNDERKIIVASIVREIHKQIEDRDIPDIFVIGNPSWKPALLGIVASRIQEDIKKPIFIWGRNGDKEIKGSCRSEGTTDLMELMNEAQSAFTRFGGHKFAGGFSVSNEKVHFLETALNNAYGKIRSSGKSLKIQAPEIIYDAELKLKDVNFDTYDQIEKISPFGTGNPKPIFLFKNVSPSEVKQFGKAKEHLEIKFDVNGKKISAISFFSKPENFEKFPEPGQPLNLLANVEKSYFRFHPELRLRIVDII